MELQSILLIFYSLLLGSMLFFAAIVAPSVFRFVSAQEAGVFLRGMFPRYYLWGIAVALIMSALAAMVSLPLLITSVIVLALFIVARQLLMPAINQARDLAKTGDQAAKLRFDLLHRLSVIINLVQMLILIAVTVYLL